MLALVKLALVKSGQELELKSIDAGHRTGWLAANGYGRAWQIVNDIEGYDAFANELKAVPRSAVQP